MNCSFKNAALGLVLAFGMQSFSMQADASDYTPYAIGTATGLLSTVGMHIAMNKLSDNRLGYLAVPAVISPLIAGGLAKLLVKEKKHRNHAASTAALTDALATCAGGIAMGFYYDKPAFETVLESALSFFIKCIMTGYVFGTDRANDVRAV